MPMRKVYQSKIIPNWIDSSRKNKFSMLLCGMSMCCPACTVHVPSMYLVDLCLCVLITVFKINDVFEVCARPCECVNACLTCWLFCFVCLFFSVIRSKIYKKRRVFSTNKKCSNNVLCFCMCVPPELHWQNSIWLRPNGKWKYAHKRTPISHIKYCIVYHYVCLLPALVILCIVRCKRRCAWLFKRRVLARLNLLLSILPSFLPYTHIHTHIGWTRTNVHLRESSYELFSFCRFNIRIISLPTFLLWNVEIWQREQLIVLISNGASVRPPLFLHRSFLIYMHTLVFIQYLVRLKFEFDFQILN